MLIIGHDRRLASLCVVSGRRSPNAMVPHHQALSSRRNRPWHGDACVQAPFCGKMWRGSPRRGNKVFGKSTSLSAAEVPAWGSAEQSAVTAAHVSRWPATRFRLCPEQSPSMAPRAIPIKTTCPPPASLPATSEDRAASTPTPGQCLRQPPLLKFRPQKALPGQPQKQSDCALCSGNAPYQQLPISGNMLLFRRLRAKDGNTLHAMKQMVTRFATVANR